MIRWANVLAIFRKDAIDAMRDARIVVSLIVPIGLGLLYNNIFPEERLATVKLGYHSDDTPAILEGIRAQTGQTVDLRVRDVADEAEARRLITEDAIDVAVFIPADAERDLRQGRMPNVLFIGRQPPAGEAFVSRALDQALREIAGQGPVAVVRVERVRTAFADTVAVQDLGPRRFFVLATIVMLIAMIGLLAVPVILTEEMEKKTIDALLMIARQSEVIAGKALVGLFYVAIGVPLMVLLTRLEIRDPLTFVSATLLLSVVIVAVGLLMAGIFKNATRVYTWSSLFVLVAFGPAIAVGLPIPDWANAAILAIPTAPGMRLMTNGIAPRSLFPDAWLSYLILVVWAVASLAVLRWQLGRREA
ncbi:MAG TPA: ABC transporter permease [Candidatus Limnocylindria bacterium]|nr:ABC transporter permease [Candidatus Limnocylindria bacterium]